MHRGWKTERVKLPRVIRSGDRLPTIAPAEVELKSKPTTKRHPRVRPWGMEDGYKQHACRFALGASVSNNQTSQS